MADQKPGITHVALDIGVRFRKGQPNIGVIGTTAFIGHHRIGKPEEGFLILLGRGILRNTVKYHPLLMAGKQPRNLIVNRQDLGTVLGFDFHNIIAIKLQNVPFFRICLAKILMAFQKSNDAHGHTTHQHILLEQQHGLIVKAPFQWLPFFKAGTNVCDQRSLVERPAELLEIQRIHFYVPFLRGNHNVLHIFLDGNQRTGLHKIVSSVCHKVFDGFSRLRAELHLIENDDALSLMELHAIVDRQEHIQRVQIL